MKIKLQDGTILDNLELNGNNFISKELIDDDVFVNNLDEIEIDGIKYEYVELIANQIFDNQSWFVLNLDRQPLDVLHERLAQTDYKIIKCYEYNLVGLDLPYDIVSLHQERQMLRDKINELK